MGWEYIKERSNEAFRKLTGVQKPTFEKMIVVLERSTATKKTYRTDGPLSSG